MYFPNCVQDTTQAAVWRALDSWTCFRRKSSNAEGESTPSWREAAAPLSRSGERRSSCSNLVPRSRASQPLLSACFSVVGLGQGHCSVAKLCPTLQPRGLQLAQPPCPHRVCPSSCPLNRSASKPGRGGNSFFSEFPVSLPCSQASPPPHGCCARIHLATGVTLHVGFSPMQANILVFFVNLFYCLKKNLRSKELLGKLGNCI